MCFVCFVGIRFHSLWLVTWCMQAFIWILPSNPNNPDSLQIHSFVTVLIFGSTAISAMNRASCSFYIYDNPDNLLVNPGDPVIGISR